MPQLGFKSGPCWETATSQRQHLRPLGHQGRPLLVKPSMLVDKAKKIKHLRSNWRDKITNLYIQIDETKNNTFTFKLTRQKNKHFHCHSSRLCFHSIWFLSLDRWFQFDRRGARPLKVAQFDYSAKCTEIAARTQGLSGREIAKLGVAWQVSRVYLFDYYRTHVWRWSQI